MGKGCVGEGGVFSVPKSGWPDMPSKSATCGAGKTTKPCDVRSEGLRERLGEARGHLNGASIPVSVRKKEGSQGFIGWREGPSVKNGFKFTESCGSGRYPDALSCLILITVLGADSFSFYTGANMHIQMH